MFPQRRDNLRLSLAFPSPTLSLLVLTPRQNLSAPLANLVRGGIWVVASILAQFYDCHYLVFLSADERLDRAQQSPATQVRKVSGIPTPAACSPRRQCAVVAFGKPPPSPRFVITETPLPFLLSRRRSVRRTGPSLAGSHAHSTAGKHQFALGDAPRQLAERAGHVRSRPFHVPDFSNAG